jgi:uncharacterized protein YbdZ (MbtH family)
MTSDEQDDLTVYNVVVNHEEQYSIWPAHRENPLGWTNVGKSGVKADCLAYIKDVWTDMRPLSLRKKMAEAERQPPPRLEDAADASPVVTDLVSRLSEGTHRLEVSLRPQKTLQGFKECIDRGYVHLKFTETRGGTELGVRLDPSACDLSRADFGTPAGAIRLVGGLTLDYVEVRCIAEIDLSTLAGSGHLEPVHGA